jgi:dUTP pyrophosphatase
MARNNLTQTEGPTVKIVKSDPGIDLPAYASEGAAGMDIRAFLPADMEIPPLGRAQVPTGLFLEIPQGYEAQVRPRSGLAAHCGVTVLNSPGTIDSDYRGELKVILVNLSAETFIVKSGDRIAQLVIAPASRAALAEACALSQTGRGAGGFGSTGV